MTIAIVCIAGIGLLAAVTLAIIPILILFFFCQRFVVEGLTASGIKE